MSCPGMLKMRQNEQKCKCIEQLFVIEKKYSNLTRATVNSLFKNLEFIVEFCKQ